MAGSKFFGKKKKTAVDLLTDALGEQAEDSAVISEQDSVVKPDSVHQAYNVFYDSATKKYNKVTIEYDIDSGFCEIVDVAPFTDNLAVASNSIGQTIALKLFKKTERQ